MTAVLLVSKRSARFKYTKLKLLASMLATWPASLFRSPRLFRKLHFTSLVFFLSACQSSELESDFKDYNQRLSNIYKLEFKLTPPQRELLQPPTKRDISYPPPKFDINIIQMLSITRCELSGVIAEHNNGMSKFQGTEEQLFYDLEFIRLASTCMKNIDPDKELHQVIKAAQRKKLEHLPKTLFSALFSNDETQRFFSTATPLASTTLLESDYTRILESIQWQLEFSQDVLNYRNGKIKKLADKKNQFNNTLKVIGEHKAAGGILLSAHWLGINLSSINQLIKEQKHALCSSTPKGQILLKPQQKKSIETVFLKYYIQNQQKYFVEIQRWIDAIRQYQLILDAIPIYESPIYESPIHESPIHESPTREDAVSEENAFIAYWNKTWLESEDSYSALFKHQVVKHSLTWNDNLRACKLIFDS